MKKRLLIILCLILALSVTGSVRADEGKTYPIMHPDQETLQKWIESYNAAPLAHIDLERFQMPSPTGSLTLLDHLQYTPSERDQVSCGNCWAWAGTGCLGIALHVNANIKDRLSMQYINSCETAVIGKACCDGGWLYDVANFYTATKRAIPWSNTNAHWQSGDGSCGPSCSSISTTPNYPITSISEETITTQTVNQDTAITNIKNVLVQNKAVWFGFFLPRSADWDDFRSFWTNSAESVIYDIDQFCGITYAGGGGHAVLCVGYNDEAPGTADDYWIMLNSWGTETGRPDGLFRITMDMNYNCINSGLGYSFYWQSLDVTFSLPTITFDTNPASIGTITFDGDIPDYEDEDTVDKAVGTYDIIGTPGSEVYTFNKWEVTENLSVADSTSDTTTCTVTDSGTLKMVLDETAGSTITFDTDPASTGTISFGGVSWNDGNTLKRTADTYDITGNPGSCYAFSEWEVTENLPIADPTSATTTCTVNGDGTLKMVQKYVCSEDDDDDEWYECLIATAAYTDHPLPITHYQSPDHPVTILRRFRDEYLLANRAGRAFVSFYNKVSPPIAHFIENKEPLKKIVRFYLKPVVWAAGKILK